MMRKIAVILLAILFAQTLPVCYAYGSDTCVEHEIYVSNSGNDAAEGSKAAPFATLARAQEEVRKLNDDMKGDIVVYLRGGIYRQTETLFFGAEDGGTNGYYVNYMSYPGEQAEISGSREIADWKKTGGMWYTDLEGVEYVPQLYVNGKRAQRAQSKVLYDVAEIFDDESDDTYNVDGIIVNDRALARYRNQKDVQLHFGRGWRNLLLNVEDIRAEGEKSRIFMYQPAFYEAANTDYADNWYRIQEGNGFWVENAFEELDEEGEFYYNREEKRLWYKPRAGENIENATAEMAVVDVLLKICGDDSINRIENLAFKDLVFSHSTWLRASRVGHVGDQAQDMVADPNDSGVNPGTTFVPAGIQIDRAERISFVNNVIKDMGGVGIGLYQGVINSNFTGNVFCDLGDSAMTVGSTSQAYADKEHQGRNLSGGKATKSSGYSHRMFKADKANDLNLKTGWSAGGKAPYFWQVDLGDSYEIDRVEIDDRPEGISKGSIRSALEILGSNDPEFKEYEVLYSLRTGSYPTDEPVCYPVENSGKFRYVRIQKTDMTYMFLTEVRVINESMEFSPVNESCKYNYINNNYITRIGLVNFGAPGMQFYYVENTTVSHNYIYDVPYSGICMGWGWSNYRDSLVCHDNKIVNNRIEKILQVNFDGGGIYTLGQQRGSLITGNYISNSPNANGGVYFDNGTMHYTARDNVVEDVAYPFVAGTLTGDNTWVRNYTTVPYLERTLNFSATCSWEEPILFAPGDYPTEALEIMDNAGLQDEWKNIVSKAGPDYWDMPYSNSLINVIKDGNNEGVEQQSKNRSYLGRYVDTAKIWTELAAIGDGLGMYPQSAVSELQKEIEQAEAVFNSQASLEEIAMCGMEFRKKMEHFKGTRITYDAEKTIEYVDNELQNTSVGNKVGDALQSDFDKVKNTLEQFKLNKADESVKRYLENSLLEMRANKITLDITGASMEGQFGDAIIDNENSVITIPVLYSEDVSAKAPMLTFNENVICTPGLGTMQNFNQDVVYTLKTKTGESERKWTIRAQKPEPISFEGVYSMKDVISDKANWNSFGSFNISSYIGKIYQDVEFEFDMEIAKFAGDWPCIMVRSQDPTKSFDSNKNSCYVFVFSEGKIEMHRFNNGVRTQFYGPVAGCTTIFGDTLQTDAFRFGEKNKMRITTRNEDGGVRVILNINGETVLNVFDNYKGAIATPGYFATVAPNTPIILSAE